MTTLRDMIERTDQRRAEDAQRYADLDGDLCQLCHAYGADKRNLFLTCLYAVHEVVPEAIDTYAVEMLPEERRGDYYLRICKACRAGFLNHLQQWRNERVALRGMPKDHDGYVDDDDPERTIPYRVNGATVMLTREEWLAKRRE